MSIVEDLAAQAARLFVGINWEALAAKNGKPVDEQIWTTDYIYDYMLPAFDRMTAVVHELNSHKASALIPTASFADSTHAFDAMWGDVKKEAPTVLERAMDGLTALLSSPFKVTMDLYKSFLYWAWHTAATGTLLHVGRREGSSGFNPDYLIHRQGYTDEEIVRHAVYTTTLCESFALLDGLGAFAPLRAMRTGTSGLGAVPALVIPVGAIVFVGLLQVAMVALVAWMLVSMIDVSQKNKLRADACKQVLADPNADAQLKASCVTPVEFKEPLGLEKILLYAGLALGGYMLITVLPDLLRSARETRAIIRET